MGTHDIPGKALLPFLLLTECISLLQTFTTIIANWANIDQWCKQWCYNSCIVCVSNFSPWHAFPACVSKRGACFYPPFADSLCQSVCVCVVSRWLIQEFASKSVFLKLWVTAQTGGLPPNFWWATGLPLPRICKAFWGRVHHNDQQSWLLG